VEYTEALAESEALIADL
jgi:hypothetical protein